MSLTVMVVDGKRFLINEETKASDKVCKDILEQYPSDVIVEFEVPTLADVIPKSLRDIVNDK